jgi:CrcB protein
MRLTLILLGAAVGGPMRFVIDQKIRTYTTKPYGIFAVNIFGSFLLGLTYGRVEEGFDLFAIGFAGAFTTWSTFMLDIYLAYELKRHKEAWVNLVMSLGVGLFAAWIGIQLAPS